jgi:hypothetical protein
MGLVGWIHRESHPEYVRTNLEKQKIRNKSRTGRSISTISQKIVKTDALIVALQPYRGIEEQQPIKSG